MRDKPTSSISPFFYDFLMQGPLERFIFGKRRRKVIAPLHGLILEIGAGTGLALRHYSPDARVVATEPDLPSIERLAERARSSRTHVVVVAADAMRLPFPDGLFDGLACNLALCTIPDPLKALAEVQRVLKPGAPAHFLEHVRGEKAWQGKMQDVLAPAWAKIADGCRLNQDTERVIREAGLKVERVERKRGLFLPMKLIWARVEA